MKKYISKHFTLTLLLALSFVMMLIGANLFNKNISAKAATNSPIEVLEDSSPYLDTNYLEIYSIPTTKFTYSTDGGMDSNLKNAFDRNFNSYWESDHANGKKVGEPAGQTLFIQMEFESTYTIDRVLFGSEPNIERGFPTQFKLYAKIDSVWQELQEFETSDTTKMIMISFQPTTLSGLKLEYIKVSTKHRWSATCKELILLQPECNEMEQVRHLFKDYAELELNDNIKTLNDINSIRTAISGYASESMLEAKLKRAEQIISKTLKFDPQREMSTDESYDNLITRRGNIADYARNTLKMAWFGTNRQSTGIYVKPHEVLTIYVEAQPNDKLPTVCYSQFWGHWKKWLSDSYQLRPGKNVIEIQSLIHDINEYTHFDEAAGGTILGGPVYISNPYKPNEQSDKVKIYFEGGTLFPVYRLGGDETRYKYQLDDYTNYVLENPTTAINVTELVSNNFIMTVRATVANPIYKIHSPEENLNTWDTYIQEVLAFDGVVFDPSKQYYDERSQYLNCNVRIAQPTGAAYAHIEHVGIQPDWEQAVLYTQSFGWGYTHEFGHMMDNPERTVSECSNNMMSKYNETAMEKDASRGEFESTLNSLSPDDYKADFFDEHDRLNYLIWWLIESYDIGFWAKLENLYRYEPVTGLAATEKQVYLSSLAAGFDLSYYYERFGYSLSGKENRDKDPIFKIANASDTFNDYMQAAKTAQRITDTKKPKLWYLDSKQYLRKLSGSTSCYSETDKPHIVAVSKSSNGYNIQMSSSKSNQNAHLGYEIWEGSNGNFKIVGFSHSDAWTDTRTLPDTYTPTYKVVAYDRDLNTSGFSTTMTPSREQNVCRINDIDYTSLSAAVKAANGGDTIYIYKDCIDSDIIIDKNITIRIDDSVDKDITISLIGKHNLFYVHYEKTLKLFGNSDHRLIIDGGNYIHEGSLVRLAGYMDIEYVTLQNSKSKTDGGAIRIVYEGSYQSLNAKFVEIKNCSGIRGGAIYDGSRYMTVTLDNCKIMDNSADYGGALFMENGTVVYIKNSEIYNNTAIYGGAIAGDSYIEINASKVYSNTATKYGGAICFATTVDSRQVYLKDNTILANNHATLGSAAYIKDGVLNVISATITDNEIALASLSDDSNYTVYLTNSTLSVHAGRNAAFNAQNTATLQGSLYIDSNSQMLVYGKAFEVADSKLMITLEDLTTGKVYCEAIDFEFSDIDADKLQVTGDAIVATNDDNHSVLQAALQQAKFTFVVNGTQTITKVDVNSMFTLPYECGLDDKYAISWNNNSNIIASGTQIKVTTDQTFVAVLADKFKLKLSSSEQNDEYYLLPGSKFVLPNPTYTRSQFICWLDEEDNQYFPYSQVEMTDNITLHASIANKLQVTIKLDGNKLYNTYVNYDEYINFPDVEIPEGKRIAYYLINGRPSSTCYLNITSDVEIDAVLEDIPVEETNSDGTSGNLVKALSIIGVIAVVIIATIVTIIVIKKKKSYIR